MKMVYFIVLGGLITVVFFVACKRKNTANGNEPVSQRDTNSLQPTKENPYIGIRNMALKMTPQMLELSLPTDKTIVYGVIMDWGMDGYTTTAAAFSSGAASIYLSN